MANYAESNVESDFVWLRKLRKGGCVKERCDTCNIRCNEIADRLEALAAENAKLREALEKYADEKNWEYCETPDFGEMVLFTATWDGPTIAREALKGE